ncbi:MAG: methyltransferase domain-containing protein [Chloroflexi bacterium]|nr:methyltransferase domain-containing protein [Chloroflexota bacterium]
MRTPGAATAASLDAIRRRRLRGLLICVRCHGALRDSGDAALVCPSCGARYSIRDGVVNFVTTDQFDAGDGEFQAQQMLNSTLTARLFNAGRRVVSSEYAQIDHIDRFLQDIPPGSLTVELGSGDRRLGSNVINVDLFAFPHVDLAADIAHTPFADDTVDRVILDSVLEHVPQPHAVVDEAYRILKPGGKAICITPFVFPYHGYPKHYFNISKDGIEFLCRNFSECQVETAVGPTSGMVNLLAEYVGVAVGGENKLLYTASKGAALLPLFLLKYLDRLWGTKGRSTRMAATLCAVATK